MNFNNMKNITDENLNKSTHRLQDCIISIA